MKLKERIEHSLSIHAKRPAITLFSPPDKMDTLTYRDLAEKIGSYSSFLIDRGLKSGDFVMTYMNKSPLTVQIIFSALINWATPSCLNSKIKSSQIFRLCRKHEPNFVAIDKYALISISGIKESPNLKSEFLFFDIPPHSKTTRTLLAKASKLVRITTVNETDQNRFDQTFNDKPFDDMVPGFCLFTSGSTGEQKGVLIPRDDLYQRAITEAEDYELNKNDCLLSLLPFSFDVGLNQLLSCFFSGAHLVIMNSWFPKDIISAIKIARITGISGVPAIWADMISSAKPPDFKRDTSTLRYITVSGGDLPADQLAKLKDYLGNVNIYKTYGQTETFRSGILKPQNFDNKMTSVGKPPKGVNIFILDEKNSIVKPNTEGEIVHSGLGKMIGYRNDPQGTSEKKRKTPSSLLGLVETDEVIFTGDRGKIDEDGYLYVLGRKDGMIKIAGNRVYPKEIEHCLLEHGQISKAAAVGIVSGDKDIRTIAVEIVPAGEVDTEEVLAFMKKRLPSYMVPGEIHIVDDLPTTDTGKIRYSVIREKYEKRRIL